MLMKGGQMKFLVLSLLAYHLIFFFQLARPLLKISSKLLRLERDFPFLGQQTKIK